MHPTHIFREYDIRGVADRDLSDAFAEDLGLGIGTLFSSDAPARPVRIALGRDCRLSSPRLFEALKKGLLATGVEVIEIGIGPTPMLYFAVHHLGTDGGIQITGSHNPGEDNGFKIMRGKGSFFGKDIQALRERMEKKEFTVRAGGKLSSADLLPAYIERTKGDITLKTTDIKFVVDAGNGAGGPAALATMRALGLNPDPLFCDMDGRFPNHHPDPTVEKNVEALIDRVRKTGARVGIAYDGDADRLGAVDANGDIIWGDKLMILFSRALLKTNPGAGILGEVKCSQTLYDDIAKHGGKPILWKTGHSLIKTKMKETGAMLAGEMSGHLFFADRYYGYDDAIYASLRLLEILSEDRRSIGEMLSDVPKTSVTPEIRVDCPDALKFRVVEKVTAHYRAAGNKVIDIDGARVDFSDASGPAWGLVRASNTGPVLVLRFEAPTPERRDSLRSQVEALVAKFRSES